MPPSYADRSYWDERFTEEHSFEWLGDGQTTIIPRIVEYLTTARDSNHLPQTLHIGAGTSKLSDYILQTYHQVYARSQKFRQSVVVVNTDFSDEAVGKAVEASSKVQPGEGGGMESRWECIDALKWGDTVALAQKMTESYEQSAFTKPRPPPAPFDIVVDKSTSDAISCGDPIVFRLSDLLHSNGSYFIHPAIKSKVLSSESGAVEVEPLQLLALHLAALVRSGGVWLCLSYSSDRFQFLAAMREDDAEAEEGELEIGGLWTVEKIEGLEAPAGINKEGVHAPVVLHHLYTLRRTAVPA
jgi:hypothetical protein